MKYIKASKLNENTTGIEDLREYFETAEEEKEKVFLCKQCQNNITLNESGVCTNCEERNEFYEKHGEVEKGYYSYLENIENIEIINDVERKFKIKIDDEYYYFITYSEEKTNQELISYLKGLKEGMEYNKDYFHNKDKKFKINFLNEHLRKFMKDCQISLELIKTDFLNLESEF